MKIVIALLAALLLLAQEHSGTNRLIHEDSPYLQQHARNPVDWYPWGDEAFEKAEKEHKPIFLSIGYSTCHWCHVMEEESFENPEIAELLNRYFIAVKVDKEELPHVDKYYQNLHVLLKQRTGGWPLTVILTETRKPLFITTYLPAEDGYGAKGLTSLLPEIARQYRDEKERTATTAAAIDAMMARIDALEYPQKRLGPKLASRTLEGIEGFYDPVYPGFSEQPKFPESSLIQLLLDIYRLDGSSEAFNMARDTLRAMAQGGIYDQIDGAFYRYAVDRAWGTPHFEKMLYTNAELISCYLRLYRIDPDPLYARIVRETIAEIDRRFRRDGLYFSASDADSGGEEGGYFLHTYKASRELLLFGGFDAQEADPILAYLGIAEEGNFDGERSNPRLTKEQAPPRLEEARDILRNARNERDYPFVDRKIITAWNAMQIGALFEASRLDDTYLKAAETSLQSLLSHAYKEGVLYHQFLYKKPAVQKGLLEDYAFLIKALLCGYEETLKAEYLERADTLTRQALTLFYRSGRWYLSDDGFESTADLSDRYYTSPLSVMLGNLLTLAALEESTEYYKLAGTTLRRYAYLLDKNPENYPEATRVALRYEKGDIVLKSSRKHLMERKQEIAEIDYPYLLAKPMEQEQYQACTVGSCFAYATGFEPVKQAIESAR